MCKAWARTPFAIGIGVGELVSKVPSVMPNPVVFSCGVGVVDTTVVIIITLLSIMANACGVCSKEHFGFCRAICHESEDRMRELYNLICWLLK